MTVSVYEKHREDWEYYKSIFPKSEDCARLFFATSILSDVQAMTTDRQVVEEINEVKQLLIDAFKHWCGAV
jgi:hypothetical protein